MKKALSILLALVLCLSLCACCEKNDVSSTAEESIKTTDTNMGNEITTAEESVKTTDTNAENETDPSPDYASEFADMLSSGKWVGEATGEELVFNADGTCTWLSDEGNKEWTWCYYSYYDSFLDIPIPVAAAFSEDSGVYWGEFPNADKKDYHGHDGMMIGYNEEGTIVMSFDGQSWIREE